MQQRVGTRGLLAYGVGHNILTVHKRAAVAHSSFLASAQPFGKVGLKKRLVVVGVWRDEGGGGGGGGGCHTGNAYCYSYSFCVPP